MLVARREGIICLSPNCPGGVVSTVCRAPRSAPERKASFASLGGRAWRGRVKRKRGFDFSDKAAVAAAPSLPPSSPEDVSWLSPGCLHLRGSRRRLRSRSCGPGAAASHLLRVHSAPVWSLPRGRGQSAEASPPAPTLASEEGSASKTAVD